MSCACAPVQVDVPSAPLRAPALLVELQRSTTTQSARGDPLLLLMPSGAAWDGRVPQLSDAPAYGDVESFRLQLKSQYHVRRGVAPAGGSRKASFYVAVHNSNKRLAAPRTYASSANSTASWILRVRLRAARCGARGCG